MSNHLCQVNTDCSSLQYCLQGQCKPKELFPITTQEVLGTILISVLNSIGAAIGVGEGELLIPFLVILFQRRVHHSIHLAYATVLGGALGNFLNIGFLRHPKNDEPVINYDVNLIIIPLLLSGVMIGGLLHTSLPEFFIYLLLFTVIIYSMRKSIKNYKRAKRKESKMKDPSELETKMAAKTEVSLVDSYLDVDKQKSETDGQDIQQEGKIDLEKDEAAAKQKLNVENQIASIEKKQSQNSGSSSPDGSYKSDFVIEDEEKEKFLEDNINQIYAEAEATVKQYESDQEDQEEGQEEHKQDLEEETTALKQEQQLDQKSDDKKINLDSINISSETNQLPSLFPWKKFREFLFMLVIVILLKWSIGARSTPSLIGIPYCQGGYWVSFAACLLLIGLFFIRYDKLVRKWQTEQIESQVMLYNNNILLHKDRVKRIGVLSFVAGVLGATVGLGGAVIIGPHLIEYGMSPKYQSYTTSFFIIYTMFASMVQVFFSGDLKLNEIVWFVSISFVCSFISSKVIGAFVKRTGKQSVLLLLLMMTLILSAIILIAIMIINSVQNWKAMTEAKDVCYANLN